jgi:hypothetical protein
MVFIPKFHEKQVMTSDLKSVYQQKHGGADWGCPPLPCQSLLLTAEFFATYFWEHVSLSVEKIQVDYDHVFVLSACVAPGRLDSVLVTAPINSWLAEQSPPGPAPRQLAGAEELEPCLAATQTKSEAGEHGQWRGRPGWEALWPCDWHSLGHRKRQVHQKDIHNNVHVDHGPNPRRSIYRKEELKCRWKVCLCVEAMGTVHKPTYKESHAHRGWGLAWAGNELSLLKVLAWPNGAWLQIGMRDLSGWWKYPKIVLLWWLHSSVHLLSYWLYT